MVINRIAREQKVLSLGTQWYYLIPLLIRSHIGVYLVQKWTYGQ